MPLHFFRDSLIDRLFHRLLSYSSVGIASYVLDISIIVLLTRSFDVPYAPAVATGFLIGTSLNYLLCYFWVYRGTERNFLVGLIIFFALAGTGVVAITYAVTYLVETYAIPLLIARTLIACVVGLINFTFNTFLNFKLT